MQYILIALGGALGAVSRFGVSRWITAVSPVGFPWGTLAVNAFGSFLLGLTFGVMLSRGGLLGEELKLFVMIGFLGSFTTFSTFSLEVVELVQHGDIVRAGLNILTNVLMCVFLVWAGILLTQR